MKLMKFTSGIVVTIVAEIVLVAWVLHGVQAANKKEAAKRAKEVQ